MTTTPGHWTDLFSFVGGAIREADLGYLVLSNDEAARLEKPLSGFVQWKPTGWGDGGQEQCSRQVGEVLLVGSGDRHTEQISVPADHRKIEVRCVACDSSASFAAYALAQLAQPTV